MNEDWTYRKGSQGREEGVKEVDECTKPVIPSDGVNINRLVPILD
jgi:hypothetical protein